MTLGWCSKHAETRMKLNEKNVTKTKIISNHFKILMKINYQNVDEDSKMKLNTQRKQKLRTSKGWKCFATYEQKTFFKFKVENMSKIKIYKNHDSLKYHINIA